MNKIIALSSILAFVGLLSLNYLVIENQQTTPLANGNSPHVLVEKSANMPDIAYQSSRTEKSSSLLKTRIHNRMLSQTIKSSKIKFAFLDAFYSDQVNLSKFKQQLTKLTDQSDQATMNWIESSLTSGAPNVKRHLIEVLGNSTNEDAVRMLLEYAINVEDVEHEPKAFALRALSNMNNLKNENHAVRSRASTIMENVLAEADNDKEIIYAITKGITSLGTVKGVDTLFAAIQTTPKVIDVLSASLSSINHPEAITALGESLAEDISIESVETNIAGSALGAIGTPEAIDHILNFSETVQGEDQKQKIIAWLNQTTNEESIDLLLAVEETHHFQDPYFAEQIQELGRKIDNQSLNPEFTYLLSALDVESTQNGLLEKF